MGGVELASRLACQELEASAALRGQGGDRLSIEYHQIAAVRALVAHIWETACIICLGPGPRRYSELSAAMRAWSADPMPEGVLTRTLSSLKKDGVVVRHVDGWALTSNGQAVYAFLQRAAAAYEPDLPDESDE